MSSATRTVSRHLREEATPRGLYQTAASECSNSSGSTSSTASLDSERAFEGEPKPLRPSVILERDEVKSSPAYLGPRLPFIIPRLSLSAPVPSPHFAVYSAPAGRVSRRPPPNCIDCKTNEFMVPHHRLDTYWICSNVREQGRVCDRIVSRDDGGSNNSILVPHHCAKCGMVTRLEAHFGSMGQACHLCHIFYPLDDTSMATVERPKKRKKIALLKNKATKVKR